MKLFYMKLNTIHQKIFFPISHNQKKIQNKLSSLKTPTTGKQQRLKLKRKKSIAKDRKNKNKNHSASPHPLNFA